MFVAASPTPYFSAKISYGVADGLFLLSPANDEGHDFEPIGAITARLVDRLKDDARREPQREGPQFPAGDTAQQGKVPARRRVMK